MSTDPKAKFFFFFCEKGENGKPVVLADTKKIDPKKNEEAKEVLANAKAKSSSSGSMQVLGGTLNLKPIGGAVSKGKLETGFKIAAGNEKVLNLFQGVKVGEPEPEDKEENESEGADNEREQPTVASEDKSGSYDSYTTTASELRAPQSVDAYTISPEGQNVYISAGPAAAPEGSNVYTSGGSETGQVAAAPTQKKAWRLDKQEVQRLKSLTVNKHDDPLAKADPIMGKLLEKKQEATKELAALLKNPDVKENELQPTVRKLEQINDGLDKAQQKLNKLGVAPKQLGSEYKDEDKKFGWRATKPEKGNLSEEEYAEKLKKWEAAEKSDKTVTRYHNAEEREQSALEVDERGVVRDNAGLAAEGQQGYVMGTDKKLRQFRENEHQIVKAKRDTGEEFDQKQNLHHSSVLAGEAVAGAGGITFAGGKITSISNASGHYKPKTVQLIQTVEELLKQGALLDTTYLMLDPTTGQGVPLTGKVKELHAKSVVIQDQLETQAQEARALQHQIDQLTQQVEGLVDNEGKPRSGKEDDFARDGRKLEELVARKLALDKKLQSSVTSVTEAKKLLAKLGAGPANKFAAAVVTNLDINEQMTGADVHRAKGTAPTSTVEEFLTTGGGNQQQAASKKSMQEELVAKTQGKREQLDLRAEKRAARLQPYLKRVETQTLPKLRKQLAFALKLNDPQGKDAAARLQKVITSYETQAKSRETPSEESLNQAIQNLEQLEEKLEVLETVGEQVEREGEDTGSSNILNSYMTTAGNIEDVPAFVYN